MKIRMFISEALELKNTDLPLQYPPTQCLKIYAIRLAVFLGVIFVNLVLLGIIIFLVQAVGNNLPSLFLGFILTLLSLVFVQRLLHREIQTGLLITTRNPQLTIDLFSILFLPGVFLHELSHFVTAKLLGVRTGGFLLIPRSLPNGRLQMGYVETAQTDIVRDSLIGLAPLVVGSLFVAYVAIYRLQLLPLWDFLLAAQWDGFQSALKIVLALPDFWLWFYLIFVVSSTMVPSESDRYSWLPLGIWVVAIILLTILTGAGAWMVENLAPPLNSFLRALTLTFGLSGIIHVILLLPSMLLHRILSKLIGVDVRR